MQHDPLLDGGWDKDTPSVRFLPPPPPSECSDPLSWPSINNSHQQHQIFTLQQMLFLIMTLKKV